MRKVALALFTIALLAAAPAFAADMAVKAPPPLPAPLPSWTGFYVGANGGWGGKDPTVTFAPGDSFASAVTCAGGLGGGVCPPNASFNLNGSLGGFQIGYDRQINQNWLLGVETDFDWSTIKGTGTDSFPLVLTPSSFVASENIQWFGTVRARVGFLPLNNVLLYGTGGLAYGRVDTHTGLNSAILEANGVTSFNCNNGGGAGATNCFVGNSSRTQVGFAVGAGGEYLLWHNVSVKAEYLFVDLGHGATTNVTAQVPFGPTPPTTFVASYSTVAFHVLRGGLNWRF
jgi:outer membrane immunogenic protein